MRITYTGVLLLATCCCLVDAATWVKRRPLRQRAQQAVRNFVPNPTQSTSLNVGRLSDAIMDAIRPTLNVDLPSNRNNRGNGNGRQMPSEPAEVNFTIADIMDQYPWIENPEAIMESSNGGSPDAGNGQPIAAGQNPAADRTASYRPNNRDRGDGKTRFNNPNYLREQLDGLNRDNYNFKVAQGVKTTDGNYKVKLLQEWRFLPVYGTALVLDQESDTNLILESADGEFLAGIEDDVPSEVPTLTKEEAIERAVAYNQDQGKPLQNPSAKLIVDTIGDRAILAYLINYFIPGTQEVNDPITVAPPPTEAPIPATTNFVTSGWESRARRRRCRRRRGRARQRCFSRGITTPAPPTNQPSAVPELTPTFKMAMPGSKRPWLLMKATTGEIYKSWEGLTEYIRPTRVEIRTGNPVYAFANYNEVMYKDSDVDACYYQKPIGGGKFLRVNDKTTSNTANVYKFRCADGPNVGYDVTNQAASTRNSAFKWGSEAVSFLKRTSSSKWNFDINIETHHSGIHAVWNGQEVQLGDGDPTFFYPLTTPDTVTHEITHAFTEYNSNLEYHYQSGAISEAYSDMAATAFLDYFFKWPHDKVFKIGRTALKFNTALRDLCNPGSSSLLLYNPAKPVIESALDYTLRTDVHNGSALYSKAFCELSKTPGWSIQQAFKVFTNANAIYWTPRETFNSGACAVKKATWDLKNTLQAVREVDAAFLVVDIACDQNDWFNLLRA